MTIYELIESINDAYNIIFSLFDCNREDLVDVDTDDGAKNYLTASELLESEFVDYEIGSMDMWIDNGQIYIEINIEIDEED